MTDTPAEQDLADRIGPFVPHLRRYARALTGQQSTGDLYAAAAFEALLQDAPVDGTGAKVALFQAFHAVWASAGSPAGADDAQAAKDRMGALTPNTREALLLHSLEGFTPAEVGAVMGVSEDEADSLIQIGLEEMEKSVAGRVMIIEDEAIIAMDLHAIVRDMGHEVTGIARTKSAAVEMGLKDRPDLILADIQLADGSSGMDAVAELLDQFGPLPVIFVTAYPERLLTGIPSEPAFLIAKPYREAQVRSAIGQAMHLSRTAAKDA